MHPTIIPGDVSGGENTSGVSHTGGHMTVEVEVDG